MSHIPGSVGTAGRPGKNRESRRFMDADEQASYSCLFPFAATRENS
jgi:hypothetical protein